MLIREGTSAKSFGCNCKGKEREGRREGGREGGRERGMKKQTMTHNQLRMFLCALSSFVAHPGA
jgi:hypothetical protein